MEKFKSQTESIEDAKNRIIEETYNKLMANLEKNTKLKRAEDLFIPDFTGEGPKSKLAIDSTMEIINEVKERLEKEGHRVEVGRDPADFRDFFVYIDQDIKVEKPIVFGTE
jgi:hypothetical protein